MALLAGARPVGCESDPAEAKLEFEVATVKPSVLPAGNGMIRLGQQGGPGKGDPGRVTYSASAQSAI